MPFIKETNADGETILFVGTKKQAQDAIKEAAEPASSLRESSLAGRDAHQLPDHSVAYPLHDDLERKYSSGGTSRV